MNDLTKSALPDQRQARPGSGPQGVRIDLAGFARGGTLGNHSELMRLVERADELGYHGIWFNEFHFSRDRVPYPSTLLLGAEILARTERLRFGTSILVLPLHHPLILAEQIAQLDRQSGGRVDIGIGRGADPATYAALGISSEEARPRFEEALEILLQAWTRPRISSTGPTWRFNDVEIGPPPVQKPHPPIYVAGVSAETIAIAVRHSMPLLLSLEPNEARQLPVLQDQLARAGGSAESVAASSLARYVIVAETRDAADRALDALLDRLNTGRATRAQARGETPEPRSREAMLADYTIAGTPQDCIAQINRLTARTGVRGLRCLFSANGLIGQQEALAGMELFAAEVLPALSDQPADSVVAHSIQRS